MLERNYIEVSNVIDEEDTQSDRAGSEANEHDMKFDVRNDALQKQDVLVENKI